MPFYWHTFMGGVEPPFLCLRSCFFAVGLQLGLQSGVTLLEKWGYKSGFYGALWDIGKYHNYVNEVFFNLIPPP